MNSYKRKLLTIVTEAALETTLIREIDRSGAHGYTVTDARGKGDHGVRDAGWPASANIRVEVVCDAETAQSLAAHLHDRYYQDYAMILFIAEVEVLRPTKF
ncbi:P-II family nitrogen regulator [Nesterenkonia natronophila]|uniref:Transcriptional regulator n=1 Tax=Nesterenkonia natronophila TaxID=2174932 RepID=A0A3A4FAZ0_9MICC|nr:transcriptional regulator [Nesterenkonia natronophila]RJN31964.1 transcriptional regulator [Nesterenkonia natronophila]